MDRTIYLIRHGKIDFAGKKRMIGRTDLPLSSEGIRQAERIQASFYRIPIERAYTSPMNRCVTTAEIAMADKETNVIAVADFAEIDLGLWDDMSVDEIRTHYPDDYAARGRAMDAFTPPEGENFYQLQQRVIPAFESIFESTRGNIAIFAHAGVNRVIMSWVLDLPLRDIFEITQPYGCVNILHWSGRSQSWSIETRHYII